MTSAEKDVQLVVEAMFHHGFKIGGYEKDLLQNSIKKRIKSTHTKSTSGYAQLLANNQKEGLLLFESLSIHYSKFFRNSFTCSVLEHIIIPKILLRKKNSNSKEIRLWSAACASGQEPYSLAILMEQFKAAHHQDIKYRIFATDHTESQINNAIKGEFHYAEIANLSVEQFDKWMTKKQDKFSIDTLLKRHVDFSVFDLLNDKLACPTNSIFGEFDIIICSNLLFYYHIDNRTFILEKVQNCMAKNGYIVCGETEREILVSLGFTEVYPDSCIFTKHQ